MTPSPNTREYSRGMRSWFSTCSTATLSVAAKITPNAKQSCARAPPLTTHDALAQFGPGRIGGE